MICEVLYPPVAISHKHTRMELGSIVKPGFYYGSHTGIVHPKIEITSRFTYPHVILSEYDILLSDDNKKCPGSSKLYN